MTDTKKQLDNSPERLRKEVRDHARAFAKQLEEEAREGLKEGKCPFPAFFLFAPHLVNDHLPVLVLPVHELLGKAEELLDRSEGEYHSEKNKIEKMVVMLVKKTGATAVIFRSDAWTSKGNKGEPITRSPFEDPNRGEAILISHEIREENGQVSGGMTTIRYARDKDEKPYPLPDDDECYLSSTGHTTEGRFTNFLDKAVDWETDG